jgi:hypothetical protein
MTMRFQTLLSVSTCGATAWGRWRAWRILCQTLSKRRCNASSWRPPATRICASPTSAGAPSGSEAQRDRERAPVPAIDGRGRLEGDSERLPFGHSRDECINRIVLHIALERIESRARSPPRPPLDQMICVTSIYPSPTAPKCQAPF